MRTSILGAVAGAATLALVAGSFSPAVAAPAPGPAAQSTQWMGGELKDGLLHNPNFGGFDDYGLTLDFGFALEAAGKNKLVKQIRTGMAPNAAAYAGSGTSIYAGSTAKLASFAEAAGANPANFGGVDLIAQLEGRVATSGPITGRIEDQSDFGDYANVVGQGFAVRALSEADSPQATSATDFLLAQQCDAGYFRVYFTEDKDVADQSCDGAPAAEKKADTDATALTILNLLEADDSPEVKAAIRSGVQWLRSQQKANGAFGGGAQTKPVNANSTALAAWVFAERDLCAPAKKSATWVKGLQLTRNYGPKKLSEKGAVAYNKKALNDAKKKGITKETQDQFRRATAPSSVALLALTKAGCKSL